MKKDEDYVTLEWTRFILDTKKHIEYLSWTCAAEFYNTCSIYKKFPPVKRDPTVIVSPKEFDYTYESNFKKRSEGDPASVYASSFDDVIQWEKKVAGELLKRNPVEIDDINIRNLYAFLTLWKISRGLSLLYGLMLVDKDSDEFVGLRLFRTFETYKHFLEKKAFYMMGYWDAKIALRQTKSESGKGQKIAFANRAEGLRKTLEKYALLETDTIPISRRQFKKLLHDQFKHSNDSNYVTYKTIKRYKQEVEKYFNKKIIW